MIREIVFYPAPVLRKVGAKVDEVTPEIRQLAEDMVETMYDANGVGLAAPQVGESLQLAVIDVSHDEECVSYLRVNGEEKSLEEVCPIVFMNPKVEPIGEKDTDVEGCLSFPDLRSDITRPYEVKAEFETLDGETITVETDGLFARAIQHEVDHLFGKLFIDRMTSVRKMAIKNQLKEMQRLYG
ncbi:MAG: peptide deformylase [Verrucomicrobiales bacterium]|nr:peptide deformylase [Verrucomicrobiales bacterium]